MALAHPNPITLLEGANIAARGPLFSDFSVMFSITNSGRAVAT
jgi:hypothetical protein